MRKSDVIADTEALGKRRKKLQLSHTNGALTAKTNYRGIMTCGKWFLPEQILLAITQSQMDPTCKFYVHMLTCKVCDYTVAVSFSRALTCLIISGPARLS